MKTIETSLIVTEDGNLILPQSQELEPGEYEVLLVIEKKSKEQKKKPVREFPPIHVDRWPENFSVRREDIYDDRVK